MNVPRRGVGDSSVDRLVAWACAQGRSFGDALEHAGEAGLTARAAKGVDSLRVLLAELGAMRDSGAGPGELVEAVAQRTGYRAELEAAETLEALARLENIAELQNAAADYDELDEFLESVALVSDVDELEAEADRVSLMTLHTAKGLEFLAVFLVGMEDGVFPHLRALEDPGRLEEERRLAYVGITRARRHLYVSHAWSRTSWGTTSYAIPSRFLSELPDELVHEVGGSSTTRPDPLDAFSVWGRRRIRDHRRLRGGSGYPDDDAGESDPGRDEEPDLHGMFEDTNGEAEAFHDPDPWREAERVPTTSGGKGRTGGGSGRRRAGGRKVRLPKMAEERFGQGPPR